MTVRVDVATDGGNYPILINAGSWTDLAMLVKPLTSKVIIATDSNVKPLYAQPVCDALAAAGLQTLMLECQAGETAKAVSVAANWWEKLAEAKINRQAVVVAVGGGVVGDLAGFVASTHLRGLRFIQVPTTLLAQVDSSVGGKVGINLPQGKNLVGSFWQPELVWIDTEVLKTLSDREYAAGLAEVVKYAVIADAELFDWLLDHADAIWNRQVNEVSRLIQRCCQIKAQVVQEDTRETTGRRAILNFGHTVGHAIEQLSGYGTYLHGEAVAIGMVAETRLAHRMGKCSGSLRERLESLLLKFHLPTCMPEIPFPDLLACMQGDKKNTDARIVFVLPDAMGQVSLCSDAPLESGVFE